MFITYIKISLNVKWPSLTLKKRNYKIIVFRYLGLATGVNFINGLIAAFTSVDPKLKKKKSD